MTNTVQIRALCFACGEIIHVSTPLGEQATIISDRLCPACWQRARYSVIVVELCGRLSMVDPQCRTGNMLYVGLDIASKIEAGDGRMLDELADDRNVVGLNSYEYRHVKQRLEEMFGEQFRYYQTTEDQ